MSYYLSLETEQTLCLLSLSIFDTKSHLPVAVTICLENTLQQHTCISHISKMAKPLDIAVKRGTTNLGLTINPEIKTLINTLTWDTEQVFGILEIESHCNTVWILAMDAENYSKTSELLHCAFIFLPVKVSGDGLIFILSFTFCMCSNIWCVD